METDERATTNDDGWPDDDWPDDDWPDDDWLRLGPTLVRTILTPLKRSFVAKDALIDLLGLALASGHHLFILGPPGTAKSALIRQLARHLDGPCFDYLLTRFTEPSELFGPFDIRKLREGHLVTNTDGMLPEADLVFLDELLNANSAVLNSLLTALNERTVRRGRTSTPLPTVLFVGASNHLPQDPALAALFDRFPLRARSLPVPDEHLPDLLRQGWSLPHTHPPTTPFRTDDVRRLQAGLAHVDLEPVRPQLATLLRRIRAAGLPLSDRRAVISQRLLAASAALCGRRHALPDDLWVLRHMWDTPDDAETLRALVDDALPSSPDPDAHPRAHTPTTPDPDQLARDLDALDPHAPSTPDRLAALAARLEWIPDPTPRDTLRARVDALWAQLHPQP